MNKIQVEIKFGLHCKFMSNSKQFEGSQFNITVLSCIQSSPIYIGSPLLDLYGASGVYHARDLKAAL